jgi:hypothetical protein
MTRLTGPRCGAVTGLLAAGVLLTACTGPAATPSPTLAGGESTPEPTTCPAFVELGCTSLPVAAVSPSPATPPPATAGPTPASLAGFQTASVTFVSPQDGWVLGTVGSSLALARSQDGGTTWTSVPPPPTGLFFEPASVGVSGIRFADQQDGWAYGSQLWATHDGGGSWTQISLPGLSSGGGAAPIEGLEIAAGLVYAVYFGPAGFEIASSPVASDSWTVSPTAVTTGDGPGPSAQLVIQGSAGWLIGNDRTVVRGASLQSGAWGSWTPPCTTVGGGAVLAASSSEDLLAACDQGVWGGGPIQERAYTSTDGGASFSELATVLPAPCNALASRSPSVAAAGCGSDLVETFNGGGSWSTVYAGAANTDIAYAGFTTPNQGVAISGLGTLLMTHDGGHTWVDVDI